MMGRRKLPKRYAGLVMPLILSLFMTCIVSAISLLMSHGLDQEFFRVWPSAWMISWVIAFPVLLLVLPLVRRIVNVLVEV